jgi:tetratricopeptide (TPR) repeat protein
MRRAPSFICHLAAGSALALAALTAAPPARAQEGGGDAAAKRAQTVTRLNAEGTAFFKARDYRKALERFNEAYGLEAEPDLLYNIARCHEALGESALAIEKYARYVEQPGADAEGRARAEEKLRSLRQAQAAGDARGPKGGAGAARPAAAGSAPEGRSYSPWTWIALGVGGAAAAGGTVLFLGGVRDHNEVTDAPNYGKAGESTQPSSLTRARAQELVDAGDQKKLIGVALWGVGGAALATSAVLFLLERPKPSERGPSVGVAPGPGGGSLWLTGRF